MIISVSGRKGHGKDTVGKIIQYLLATSNPKPHHYPYTYQEFLDRGLGDDIAVWQIKKWADKLKEMLCILTGTIREQWEDSVFKNTQLGEEWWYYKIAPNVILPRGYYPNQADNDLCEARYLVKPTYRNLLELLGTDCGRNIIHPNIWVNSLMSGYKPQCNNFISKLKQSGSYRQSICETCTCFPNWIITDTRFPNELDAVKSKGGLTIKVVRDKRKCGCVTRDIMQCDIDCDESNVILHESETALDNVDCKYTIYNNGTIQNLIEKVKLTLIEEKLI